MCASLDNLFYLPFKTTLLKYTKHYNEHSNSASKVANFGSTLSVKNVFFFSISTKMVFLIDMLCGIFAVLLDLNHKKRKIR